MNNDRRQALCSLCVGVVNAWHLARPLLRFYHSSMFDVTHVISCTRLPLFSHVRWKKREAWGWGYWWNRFQSGLIHDLTSVHNRGSHNQPCSRVKDCMGVLTLLDWGRLDSNINHDYNIIPSPVSPPGLALWPWLAIHSRLSSSCIYPSPCPSRF